MNSKSFVAACGLLLAVVGTPLYSAQLTEEIIVYASKRPDEARRQPVAAAVVTARELAAAGIRDLSEMQSLVPGLTLNRATSSNSVAFGIRGNSTNSVNSALEPSVGLYVDGVPRARQGAMINNLVDVQRVEVLKGPAGHPVRAQYAGGRCLGRDGVAGQRNRLPAGRRGQR